MRQMWGMILLVVVLVFSGFHAHGKRKKRGMKKASARTSIVRAMKRSRKDYRKRKKKVDVAARSIRKKRRRRPHTINIKRSPSSMVQEYGDQSFYQAGGEDQSGLNSLKAPVYQEEIEVDFDKELEEISSL